MSKKTLVLMSDTRPPSTDFNKVHNLAAYNNYLYAEAMGYDFKYLVPEFSEKFEGDTEINCVNPRTGSMRHASWSKILSIHRELPNYDTVVYVDSDTYFNSFNCLHSIIAQKKVEQPVKFLVDVPWSYKANTSCIIVDRTPEALQFLRKWFLADGGDSTYDNKHTWEQNYAQDTDDAAVGTLNINQLKVAKNLDDKSCDRFIVNHVSSRISPDQYDIVRTDVVNFHGHLRFNKILQELSAAYISYSTEEETSILLKAFVSHESKNIVYNSKDAQDRYFIEEVAKLKPGGVFLDIGLGDGKQDNNTYALEKYLNWTGACINFNGSLQLSLTENRPGSVCIDASNWDLGSREQEQQNITEALKHTQFNVEDIDYVSIHAPGLELNILNNLDLSHTGMRYLSIRHDLTPTNVTQLAGYLKNYNYTLNRTGLSFVEFIKNTKAVRSWDCFDTLVARRRKEPYTVFDIVGKKLKLEDFKEKRIRAEQLAPHTIDEIYVELGKMYSWADAERRAAQRLEVATELEECFPIMENILQMKSGDIVVSDMYLKEEHIAAILENCGVTVKPKIYVSYGGKHTRSIWRHLPKIDTHTGDNYYADIQGANSCNIKANHYTKALQFTGYEELVGGDLALLMRVVRLMNPYTKDDVRHTLWYEQAQLNIPALILASLELPADNLSFVYRDCTHLQPIHELLHGCKNTTFHCSRAALANGGEAFREYAAANAYGKGIVDLHGSGRSLQAYWKTTFDTDPELHYLTGKLDFGEAIVPVNCDVLERFNSSKLGSLIKWPDQRAVCEFNSLHVSAQHAAVKAALNEIPKFKFLPDKDKLYQLIYLMYFAETPALVTHYIDHTLGVPFNWNNKLKLSKKDALAVVERFKKDDIIKMVRSWEEKEELSVIICASYLDTHPDITSIREVIDSLDLTGISNHTHIILAHDQLNAEQAKYPEKVEAYQQYFLNLKKHIKGIKYQNTQIVVAQEWGHLTRSLKNAMQYVKTKYVLVLQHDIHIRRKIPVQSMVDLMQEHKNIKHLRFNVRKNLPTFDWWDGYQENGKVIFTEKAYSKVKVCLTPAWSDQNHLTTKDYYENVVFPDCTHEGELIYDFMENKLNPLCHSNQERYGTYIYGGYGDARTSRHSDGRKSSPEADED